MNLLEAGKLVQEHLSNQNGEEQLLLFQEAAAGNHEAARECEKIIEHAIRQKLLIVEGHSSTQAAKLIRQSIWGLGSLESVYRDPTVDEIRVLGTGKVFVSRRGKNEPLDMQLSREEVTRIIERMIPYNETGVGLNESSPMLELVRADGSRLTALCPPVAKGPLFVLRKHGTIEMTPESLISLKTIDERVWKALRLLVKGRRNILLSGSTNSGKTTLLKMLIGEISPVLAVRILDTDNEIRAEELYPDRDIIELEAHPEAGASMSKLFEKILRLSPDVIIVGEFRGYGEAVEAIRACTRGHDGSMATTHFSSPEEAVRGTAMMMLEEGLNLSLKMAMSRVAQAFNIVVQMFADSEAGIKKVESITEIYETGGSVCYRELLRWQPDDPADYLGAGRWALVNPLSSVAIKEMAKYGVAQADIEEVFSD